MLCAYAQKIESRVMEHDTIALKDIIRLVGHDSILVILILLSALNIILSPLPINSFVLGIPLFIFSLFYLFKWDLENKEWSLFKKQFSCKSWRNYINALIPYIVKFEKLSSPRWHHAMILENRIISGLSLSLLAMIIFLPIPFANIPGSIGMILVSLGILQRDGAFVLLGYLVFLLHVAGLLLLGYTFTSV
jgi:hypothetical protein